MKKALSWLLALAMVVGMVPQVTVSASAAGDAENEWECSHTYENGVCTVCGEQEPEGSLSLRYDDRLDMSGKTVEILDAGAPTSYQVGYGVEENAVRDTAVVTLVEDKLIATGIGSAKVRIDGVEHEVRVTAAPISLLLLIGQSNMRGSEGNANQSIVCPEGLVYATYGDDRGESNTAMTAANAARFAPSALTGAYSAINAEGTTDCLSGYPVNSLTEAGAGKIGPDSGFAYEWVKQTGEKVWVVNAAHGGTSINVWQPGTTEYEQCQALFTACQETLRKEIAAGHFALSHMGYFWCQGCSDRGQSAQWYVNKYLAMHNGLKTELSFDHDSNADTADKTFEFGGIIPVRVGSTTASYRDGVYETTNPYAYHESYVDLRFSGPRVAQYWMTNNPELEDIWLVCDIGEDWVWMPDGTNGVSAYFQSHYPNGTVDYQPQVAQKASWYTPTTPAAVHDSIHYNQIGYNEIGRESVRNALIMLGEREVPEVETTVELLSWDGYTPVERVTAATVGSSATLVVPKVSPVWKSKEMTYELSEGLSWNYYDLLAANAQTVGSLIAGDKMVNVEKAAPYTHFIDHLVELPEKICCGTNLWSVLEHDEQYFANGSGWGYHSSKNVPSVTFEVNPGDKIFATSFGAAKENGHASSNGIRMTFFGINGVVKTTDPAGTYAEFAKNGGYLIAPEGAVAINVPMWNNSDDNEIYILNRDHVYANGTCTVCGEQEPVGSLSMRYDDHYDVSGKTVEIIDAGTPTSYQVGYGVAENAIRDAAVVTLAGEKLIATGIGSAVVSIDGVEHEVRVTAAPISLLLLAGQSNMQGIDGSANQSVICPDGQVYGTYADRYQKTVEDLTVFAPSALTGSHSTINVSGNSDGLKNFPVNMFTETGKGREGMDSGLAYEWVQQTGEKVWVVNLGYGGSSILGWLEGGVHYQACQDLWSACQETLRREIAAGHFTLSHMGYFWCQGCADEVQSAQWYADKFQTMHELFRSELTFDHDSDPATAEKAMEFAGIIPIRSGHEGRGSYRAGVYTDTTRVPYYQSFKDLRFNGPRVAQYWMGNNPELTDIWNVCTIQEGWATLPDGTDGVEAYFRAAYENGTVDYPVQVKQSAAWYAPKTPAAVHDNIHYNQIGYNELGRESARNALIMLGEIEAPEAEASVAFVGWDGFTSVEQISASSVGHSGTLAVPMVSPVWMSKEVTYSVSDGLSYDYYDLLSASRLEGGTLTAVGAAGGVTVEPTRLTSYLWTMNGSDLVSDTSGGDTANTLKRLAGTVSNGQMSGVYYQMSQSILLLPDEEWGIEMELDNWTSTAGIMLLSGGQQPASGQPYFYFRPTDDFVGIGYYDGTKYHNYGLALKNYGLSLEGGKHHYQFVNRIAPDGSNSVWLAVDGTEIGALTDYYVNSTLTGTGSSYLSGREFVLSCIGAGGFAIGGCTVNYIRAAEEDYEPGVHIHNWSQWQTVTAPGPEGAGVDVRVCADCGEREERSVDGVWQSYDLDEHWSELPGQMCAGLDLWDVLTHDRYYYHSGERWGVHESGKVYSVTIPVEGGDKIFATSFAKYGENGNTIGTGSGIRVTFFGENGVLLTLAPEQTYSAFAANGGYLVAPEGAVAANIPMYSEGEENELRILSAEHCYTNGVCAGCGEKEPEGSLSMRYDDHLDMTGKTVEIVDAGDAVVSMEGNYLVATAIGEGIIRVDGNLCRVVVDKAKINIVTIMGQSNAGNHFANATSDVTCPIGTAYWWGNGQGVNATEPVDYTQPSMGFHTPLLAELYAQSVAAGDPVKNVMVWQEGITSKNGQSIVKWAAAENNTSGTDAAAAMIRNCVAYYEQHSDQYEIVGNGVYWLQGESDVSMAPEKYTALFMAMWSDLKDAGADYLAFLRVRKGTGLNGEDHEDLGYSGSLTAQLDMVNRNSDMFMATTITENWVGNATSEHSVDIRNYITLLEEYGKEGELNDSHGNAATFKDGILTTTMKSLYGSNNKCHYGKFAYGIIGADAAYNMYRALHTTDFSIVKADTSGKMETQLISSPGDTVAVDITDQEENLAFRASPGSAAGTLNVVVKNGTKDITDHVIAAGTNTFGTVDVDLLREYDEPVIIVTYTPVHGKAGSVTYQVTDNSPEPPTVYHWDFEKDLYARDENGEIVNAFGSTAMNGQYILEDGMLKATNLQLAINSAVRLDETENWSVEWKLGEVTDQTTGFLLCNTENSAVGTKTIYMTTTGKTSISDYADSRGYRNFYTNDTAFSSGDILKITNRYDSEKGRNVLSLWINGNLAVADYQYKGAINKANDTLIDMSGYPLSGEFVFRYLGCKGVAAFSVTCEIDYIKITTRTDDSGADDCTELGHDEQLVPGKAATCTESGLTDGKQCRRCGVVTVEQEIVAALGHSYTAVVTVPTCTEGGYTTYTCTACGDSYVDDRTEKLGHDEMLIPGKSATCTESGLTDGKQCRRCGVVTVEQKIITALGHSYTAVVTAPTCTEEGYTTYTCTACGDSYVDDRTEKLGHDEKLIPGKAATCTETGLTDGKQCTVCGVVTVEQAIIAALGHSYTAVVTAPTCTEKGYTTYTCTTCGDSYVDDRTEKLGHDEQLIPGKAATCTESGLTDGKQCRRCGVVTVEQEIVAALGHSYTAVVTAPTCTEEGYTTYTCTACGDSYVDDRTEKLGHDEKLILGKAATCTESGLTDGKQCRRCGVVTVKQEIIAALGHNYDAIVTAPTCTEGGYTTYTCTTCGDSYVDDRTEKLGHDEKLIPGKSATCTESGLTDGKQCTVCGVVTVEQEIISALGHSYTAIVTAPTCTEDGYTTYTCTTCGDSYVDDRTEKLGHDEQLIPGKSATCTENGLTEGKQCRRCGVVTVEQKIITALGHGYTAVVTKPTCTEDGYTTYTCTACGDSYVDDRTEKLGHDEQLIPGKAATCTESGLTDGKQCAVCGEILVAQSVIDATGHSFTDYRPDNNATDTEDGTKTAKCDHCDATDTVVDEGTMVKHTPGKWRVTKKATCVEPGVRKTTCVDCGKTLEEIIEPHGEAVVKIPEVPATCTKNGKSAKLSCSECGKVVQQQKTIKKGHLLTELHFDESGHWYECEREDCDAVGKTSAHKYDVDSCEEHAICEVCGYEKFAGEHIPGKWRVSKKATCVVDGLQTATCTVCKEKLSMVIEAHGEAVEEIPEVPATCTENGKTAKLSCSECGKVVQRQKVIKKGHLLTQLHFDESGHWYECEREDCDAVGKTANHKYDVDSCEEAASCEVCEYEKPAGEHIPGKWKVSKKATCVVDGLKTATCTVCKEKLSMVIEAHGEAVEEIPETPATCTENGKTAKLSCSECGKVVQQQKTIKKGHLLTELHFDESGHWYECEREDCDAHGKTSTHRYKSGVCKVCGWEKE